MSGVFICGLSRGIGLELAELYCQEGKRVYGIARSPQPERKIDGLTYRSIAAENFSAAAFPEIAGQTFDKVILNSAVFGPPTQFSFDLTPEQLNAVFTTNALAHYHVLKELRPQIAAGGAGQVSFIISKAGMPGTPGGKAAISYRVSKAAQIALGLALVHPLSEQGVALYLVNPGSVVTRIGGANARMTAAESARNVKAILEAAGKYPSGTLFDHDGVEIKLNHRRVSGG